jgi:hypothetical protein
LLRLLAQEEALPAKAPDLREAFRSACNAVGALEEKHAVLKGLSLAEPPPCTITQDADGLKEATFRYARNTANGGKPPRPAQDPAQPHFDAAVFLYRAATSAQPPENLKIIRVHGVEYHLHVMVGGSDADLVRQVRDIFSRAFESWMGPPGP